MPPQRLAVAAFAFLVWSASLAAQSYVPNRVFDSARGSFTDFEAMAAALIRADVVFLGEQHDDPNTHRLELAVLEALARRGRPVVLSLEMFERDVQEPLDHFAMGHVGEAEFLGASRPWPRYATDYKPLVDFAIAHDWPIVAANVPRAIAAEVAKSGPDVLSSKPETDRKLFASDRQCPIGDDYFKRFVEAMGGHSMPGASTDDAAKTTERYYFSQCVKDETMAEAIAGASKIGASAAKPPVIVHVNGSFHSDFRQGTAARVMRRLPGKRVIVVSIQAVSDLDAVAPTKDQRRVAEYILFTVKKS